MPQLDSLRAFAVGVVLVHHFASPALFPFPLDTVPFGFLGVRLFFVLSGFLITGILLRARADAEVADASRIGVVRQFYVRRFLRIFPLYYMVIFAGAALNLPPIREDFWWLASYLINFKIAAQGWFPENVGHFWSLAVEEQFYLLWPWVALFAPRPLVFASSLAMLMLGPVFRAVALICEWPVIAAYILTPSCFDALGAGALLAVISGGRAASEQTVRVLARTALPTGLVAVPLLQWLDKSWRFGGEVHMIFFDTATSLVFCWLVAAASRGFRGSVGKLLLLSPLMYLGHIAYGIYVYHLLLREPVYGLGRNIGLWDHRGLLFFVTASAASIALAAVSWHVLERPVNEFKRHFPYVHAIVRGRTTLRA